MFQLNKILFENNNMKDSGANGVFIKSIQPNKDDIDVEAQIAIRFNIANANKTMEETIDEAFDTSDDANATIISDNALSARSCTCTVRAKKTREINKSISRNFVGPNSIFCNFKNGQKSIFELGKSLKMPEMQFHLNKILIYLI